MTLFDLDEADAGAYALVVDNAFGSDTSTDATLSLVSPGTPVSYGAVQCLSIPTAVMVQGNHLYVGTGEQGLQIYDVAGRLLATLVDEHRDAGPHSETWKGLDGHGQRYRTVQDTPLNDRRHAT